MMAVNGLRYCVWTGVDRDLQLLIPEPGLLILDLIVQFRLLMRQFEPLESKLQQRDGQNYPAPQTEKKLDHDMALGTGRYWADASGLAGSRSFMFG